MLFHDGPLLSPTHFFAEDGPGQRRPQGCPRLHECGRRQMLDRADRGKGDRKAPYIVIDADLRADERTDRCKGDRKGPYPSPHQPPPLLCPRSGFGATPPLLFLRVDTLSLRGAPFRHRHYRRQRPAGHFQPVLYGREWSRQAVGALAAPSSSHSTPCLDLQGRV